MKQSFARQADDAAEAGDQMAGLDLEAVEGEIRETGIARRIGMPRQEQASRRRFVMPARSAPSASAAAPSSPRRRRRLAHEEQRGARVALEVPVCAASRDRSMSGEPSAAGAVTT